MTNLWSKAEDKFLLDASENGMTAHDIAHKLKRSVASVWTRRGRLKKMENQPDMPMSKTPYTSLVLTDKCVFNPKIAPEYNYERPANTYDLTELTLNMCRFPLTDTLPYYFCGKKIHRGAYCKECAKKCYK
ncbi:MAG: GcrA family cell cycle regulator [Phycisphaerales bacterium]